MTLLTSNLYSSTSTSDSSTRLYVVPLRNIDDSETSKIKFKQYVEPHLDMLYRAARNMANNPADTQDLVQETMLKAYKAIDRFDGEYPKAWLLTILRNTAISFFEKRKPEVLSDNESFFEYAGCKYAFITKVDDNEFDQHTLDAFNKLNEDAKRLLVLVDIEGFSYNEAAILENIAIGTVMSRLHRGRSEIKRQLQAKGINSSKDLA